jgi:hypothetical protein
MLVKSFSSMQDSPLSEQETEVLKGIAEGKSYTQGLHWTCLSARKPCTAKSKIFTENLS